MDRDYQFLNDERFKDFTVYFVKLNELDVFHLYFEASTGITGCISSA